MQNLEDELLEFLKANQSNHSSGHRNTELVAAYFGFRDMPWPTFDDLAQQFGLRSRQHAQLILKTVFYEKVNIDSFPVLTKVAILLTQKPFRSAKDFAAELQAQGIEWSGENGQGLLSLMHDLGLATDFGTYTPDFKRLTRGRLSTSNEVFLLQEAWAQKLGAALKEIQDLPGQLGIANLRDLQVQEKWSDDEYALLKQAVKVSGNAWFHEAGNDLWYIYENRDNTLLNYNKKVFSIIASAKADHLAEVYFNALDYRKNDFAYPPKEIIEKYLNGSVYFSSDAGCIEYRGAIEALSPIDQKTVDFLRAHGASDFKSLSAFLEESGFSSPLIKKRTMTSPLVHVDRTGGRRNFVYSLVQGSQGPHPKPHTPDRYTYYSKKLLELMESGTDKEVGATGRKEQRLLQDWLFKDKTVEQCAICGKQYTVSALVTAHKKCRADCTAAERLDPNIVMPVCLFGCDYLYERGYLLVEKGLVILDTSKASSSEEYLRAKALAGRTLDPQWAVGEDKGYFDRG